MNPLPRWWLPELFLIVGIPLVALLGGALTLSVASGDLSDDGVHAGVQRTAQVQTADLAPDLAAARDGLSAQLRIDRAGGLVRVHVPRGAPGGAALEIDFLHNLQQGRDLHARLQPRDGDWVAAMAPDAGVRWRVVLAGMTSDRSDRRWRLVGTLPRGGTDLDLQPAVSPP